MKSILVICLVLLTSCATTPRKPASEELKPLPSQLNPSCTQYMDLSRQPLPVAITNPGALDKFKAALKSTIHLPKVEWPNKTLNPKKILKSEQEAERIINGLLDKESQLNRDLDRHIDELGGISSAKLWDTYFKSYDKIVAYIPGYLDLAVSASQILPLTGQIADLGAGTGNFSTILASLGPERKILSLDISTVGLSVAKKKLSRVTSKDKFETRVFNLKQDKLPPTSLDGAVMNNVLYTLAESKLDTLKMTYAALKPGAPLVLNDPLDIIQQDPKRLEAFLKSAGLTAVKLQAPVTEYDLALVGRINVRVLMEKSKFLSPEDLQSLAEQAGFKTRGIFKAYYGGSTFLFLTKPLPSISP